MGVNIYLKKIRLEKKTARNWYCNLTEEQKNKKRQYGRNKYYKFVKVCQKSF